MQITSQRELKPLQPIYRWTAGFWRKLMRFGIWLAGFGTLIAEWAGKKLKRNNSD